MASREIGGDNHRLCRFEDWLGDNHRLCRFEDWLGDNPVPNLGTRSVSTQRIGTSSSVQPQ
jgi:hypothetical protein